MEIQKLVINLYVNTTLRIYHYLALISLDKLTVLNFKTINFSFRFLNINIVS